MALTKYKRGRLLRAKELAGLEFGICKEEVTYIVSQAWTYSFARVAQNKSAIADRGWNPLNYNCLLHPEIVATRYSREGLGGGGGSNSCSNEEGSSDDDGREDDVMIPAEGLQLVDQMNLLQGVSGSLINTLLEKRNRDKKKRYSSGLHVSCQRFMVGPEVLDDLEERELMQAAIISGRQENKKLEGRMHYILLQLLVVLVVK